MVATGIAAIAIVIGVAFNILALLLTISWIPEIKEMQDRIKELEKEVRRSNG